MTTKSANSVMMLRFDQTKISNNSFMVQENQ